MPQLSAAQSPLSGPSWVRPTVWPYVIEPPKPIAIVPSAAARTTWIDRLPGQKRNTNTRLTSTPAIIAPVSCPYCPRMPQPMPPAIAVASITSQRGGFGAWVFSLITC